MKWATSLFLAIVIAAGFSGTEGATGRLEGIIEDSRVIAEIKTPGDLLTARDPNSDIIARLLPPERVEILRDYQTQWYMVEILSTGKQGWLRQECLSIPPDPIVNDLQLTAEELENWANMNGGASATDYLVLVDIGRQRVSVFGGSAGCWRLVRTMVCSTGRNQSPTIRGRFRLIDRGPWFYSERLGAGGRYWIRFDGPFLFHSVAMNKSGQVIDGVLGQRASSGCVRLSLNDIKWMYDTVPDGSAVVIP